MKSSTLIFLVILAIMVISILTAYFFEYKSNPKEFTASLKSWKNSFIAFTFLFLINKTYELLLPFDKNHGTEFNKERKKRGIPVIEENWSKDNHQSEQFITVYWNKTPNKSHFKKEIEYGIFGIECEIDYFKNKKINDTYVWSKYDFSITKMEYYCETPNKKIVSISKNDKLTLEKPTITSKISKTEFEKFLDK